MRVEPGLGERLPDRHETVGAIGQEKGIGLGGARDEGRDAADRGLRLPGRVALHRHDADAAPGGRLAQLRFDDVAVDRLGDERGQRAPALRGGVIDDAVDLRLSQEAEQVDAVRGDAGVGREGDHRLARLPRHLAGALHGGGE